MHKTQCIFFPNFTDIKIICSISGNDFKDSHKKHENINKDINFNEPVNELEALQDLQAKKKDSIKKAKYEKATKKDVKIKHQKENGARKDNDENDEQDKEQRQKTWLKNGDDNYNGGGPDNIDDDYFEDEEYSPLEHDGSDLEEDEDYGNYDDKEQDYWNDGSEKKSGSEGKEQGILI